MTGMLLASYVALWALVATEAVAVFALYHHFGEMYLGSREGRERQGPQVGSALRDMQVQDTVGDSVLLPAPDRPMLLVFASTKCPLCDKMRPDVVEFAESHADVETFIVCAGDGAAVRQWVGELSAPRVIPDPGHRIGARYSVGLLPYCIGTDAAGRVRAKGIVNNRQGLEAIAEQLVATYTDFDPRLPRPLEVQKELAR